MQNVWVINVSTKHHQNNRIAKLGGLNIDDKKLDIPQLDAIAEGIKGILAESE